MATQRTQSAAAGWLAALDKHMLARPFTAGGLAFAVLALLAWITQSVKLAMAGAGPVGLTWGLGAGVAGFAATALGALPALALRRLPQPLEDSLLGFSAGMMLAASAFSLIIPGLAAGTDLAGSKAGGAAIVVLGMALGVVLMLGLDAFTPHEHDKTGPCGPGHQGCSRVWLFVFAIALHNLPEGMAMGVSFSQGDWQVGLPLSSAIALQDIPEGLAVALSLRAAGIGKLRAVAIAAVSGLLEPVGALLGVGLSAGFALAYPAGLGLAAGAMLFIVSHEVIPETHRNGHQTKATIGLMIGFALMMVLDNTLG